MIKAFQRKNKGVTVIKAASSNSLSDTYRDRLAIMYQYVDSCVADPTFVFNGKAYNSPILAGPIGHFEKAHPSGMLGYATAVKEAGSIYWGSYHNEDQWRAVLAAGVPAIRTIKPLADTDRVLEEIAKDERDGAVGYAMDIDHGLTVYGELDAQAEKFAPKTLEDFKRISAASSLPFFMKGVLSLHDALAAVEAGAAGIVLSGHNNRFPCAVPPLKLLPEVRKAVGEKLLVFVDGGINNGYDAFKALALGADGVLTARGLFAAFGQGGPEGVTEKLLEMSAELCGAMGNTGSPDLAHINRSCIVEL